MQKESCVKELYIQNVISSCNLTCEMLSTISLKLLAFTQPHFHAKMGIEFIGYLPSSVT